MMSLTKSWANSSGAAGPRVPPRPAAGRRLVCPAGITTIIGFAFFAAIRLSRMKPARPTEVHAVVAVAGAVQQVEDRDTSPLPVS